MCGRFVLNADPQTIQQAFNLESVPPTLPPRYNIAPSQPVAVIPNNNAQALEFFRWGLVPSWSKDPSIGNKMINARAETAHEKPSFRDAFKKRRCIIPATGFYEWSQNDNKKPMYIHLKGDEVFGFAGLWESWKNPEGEKLLTCTILTAEPNELVSNYHHRMAVILRKEDYEAWLSPDPMGVEDLMPLLQPYPAAQMEAFEVSKLVNSPANDVPECIVPLASSSQPSLFD